ncbi:MAG: transposase [Bacteroidetes bacterium]|nr:transposase [Bacteroidota bacterium]MBL6943694.1 transposase [Bacteroidales bacterium]
MGKSELRNIVASSYTQKFRSAIQDEKTGLKLLADIKWQDGFTCTKCGSTNYCKGKSESSRRCTRCKKEESATAHTIFHRCKIPINRAMEIAYLVCNVAAISSYELSRQLDMRHMTCYGFQKKVIECLNGESDDKLLKNVLSIVQEKISAQA